MENQPTEDNELNSLEDPGTEVVSDSPASSSANNEVVQATVKSSGKTERVRRLISRLNVYLLLFIFIVIAVGGFTLASLNRNKKEISVSPIGTQSLSDEDLKELSTKDTSVGTANQTLSVESNAVFAGKVLIRDGLEVAGTIRTGSPLNLPGLTVTGTSTFDQIQTNSLTASGDANIQGQLTVQRGLTVTGGASFGGPISAPQITVQSFQLSGDLQLQRHIDAGGASPTKVDGTKLGGGGTSSVSGTDTAGTVTINLGGSPLASDGCFVTINFVQTFKAIPHVVVTPVGPAAATLNYYVTRTTSNFQICATNTASGSFAFDYIVID